MYLSVRDFHGKQTFIIVGDVNTMGHFLLKTLENVSDSMASYSRSLLKHGVTLEDSTTQCWLSKQTNNCN